jgi:hypothetical protein
LKRDLNARPAAGRSLQWPVQEPTNGSRKHGRGDDGFPGTFTRAAIYFMRDHQNQAQEMNTDLSNSAVFLNHSSFANSNAAKNENHGRGVRSPFLFALAVAVFGLLSMLIVDHGPWNRPHVQTAESHYATTSAAARAAGATVTPTMPKPALEPVAPGPKPVQPANPVTP